MLTERYYEFDRYDIHLLADDREDIEGLLEIMAICQKTGKRSGITNLNVVIGYIIHPILGEDEDVEDASFICNDREKFEALVEHAIDVFENDTKWVKNCLEYALDDDRRNGEWE